MHGWAEVQGVTAANGVPATETASEHCPESLVAVDWKRPELKERV